jgi:hypothetical protein
MTRPKTLLATLAIATAAFCSASHAESGPFKSLSGAWSGTGTIFLEDGSSERIRCRASYAVSSDGAGMNQGLVCASDSYKFDLRSDVVARGSAVSGNWTEASRNVSGDVQGRAANGQFDVVVSAPLFTANLTLATRGNKQNIEIRSQSQFRGVSISLART